VGFFSTPIIEIAAMQADFKERIGQTLSAPAG
jgi:hypothetical protein